MGKKIEKSNKMAPVEAGMYDMVWEAHTDHLKELMKIMMMSRDTAEVTLVCDDHKQIKAHKVILSASSSFFKSVLENTNHPNPFIYLRGIDSVEMDSLLQFIYLGQASVSKAKLDQFVKVAKDLKVKELTENEGMESRVQNYQNYLKQRQEKLQNPHFTSVMKPNQYVEQQRQEKIQNPHFETVMKPKQCVEQNVSTISCPKSGCEAQFYKKENLLSHFQSFHSATGYIIYHCDTCDKKFQKKDALDVHRKNVHGKTIAISKKMSESLKDIKQNAVKMESVVQETLYENTFYAMNSFNNAENALVILVIQ